MSTSSLKHNNMKASDASEAEKIRRIAWQIHCKKNLPHFPAARKYIYAKRYFMK